MSRSLALFLALYFALGSLLPRSDFSQLWKLDDLLSHYQMHQGEQHFGSFIWEHLTDPNGHEHSDNGTEHQHLPLQSLGDGLSHLVLAQPLILPVRLLPYVQFSARNIVQWFPGDFTTDIFQPPSTSGA
jgi:hypothetical protein